MTVKELIVELNKLNPNAIVKIPAPEEGCIPYYNHITEIRAYPDTQYEHATVRLVCDDDY